MADKKTNIIDTEDLLVVLKFISKNVFLLLVTPVIIGLGAYIYAHRLPDEYGAKTQILLGSGTGYEYQSQIYQNLTGYGSGVNQITNQIRVLQSYDLISNTLDKLDFQVSYYIVGRVKTTELPNIDAFDVDIKLVESSGQL
ncbi:MAG: Wzz/FepE/Etk N-terminal domain-containing protein, partial [Bacteroidota bacterium]